MKMFVVTDDSDTLVGMRLSGVEGILAKDEQSARIAIQKAAEDAQICLIFVTEKVKEMCREQITQINSLPSPVVCEIPDSQNLGKSIGSLEEYVKNSVGISI